MSNWWDQNKVFVLMFSLIVAGVIILAILDRAGWWSFEAWLRGQGWQL